MIFYFNGQIPSHFIVGIIGSIFIYLESKNAGEQPHVGRSGTISFSPERTSVDKVEFFEKQFTIQQKIISR